MKKTILLLISLLAASAVFAETITLNEQTLQSFCGKLQNLTFTFKGSQFQNTSYANLTEFPPEVLTLINQQIMNKPQAVQSLGPLSGITFSAQILYNGTTCFNGSLLFNNSQLIFLKLYGDPLAGTSNEHINLYLETRRLGEVLTEMRTLSSGQNIGPVDVISVLLKVGFALLKMFFSGDLSIKPIAGLLKVIDGMRVVFNMPDLTNLTSVVEDRITQQLNNPVIQECISNQIGGGVSQEQAFRNCLNI